MKSNTVAKPLWWVTDSNKTDIKFSGLVESIHTQHEKNCGYINTHTLLKSPYTFKNIQKRAHSQSKTVKNLSYLKETKMKDV